MSFLKRFWTSTASLFVFVVCLVGCGNVNLTSCLSSDEASDMLAEAGLATCPVGSEACETLDGPATFDKKSAYVCAYYHPESGCGNTTEQGCNTMAWFEYYYITYTCYPKEGGDPKTMACVRFVNDQPDLQDTRVSCTIGGTPQTVMLQFTNDVPCADPPDTDPGNPSN